MAAGHSDRRADLVAAKLRALVRGHWGDGDRRPATFPRGAALAGDEEGWVLADERPAQALGGALVWADKAAVATLHVLADADTGVLARRASQFARPPAVWRVEGTRLVAAAPAPPPVEPELTAEVEAFARRLAAIGLEPVVEHGVLTGELLGLEVARVVSDEHGAVLEIGVGKHDREAQRLLHGDDPRPDALAAAMATVGARRRAHAEAHPLRQLTPERWLRAVVVTHPELVGAARLAPRPATLVRHDLRDPAPAPAAGEDAEGRPLMVVCSTGVDLDLVPSATDARLAWAAASALDPEAVRLLLVVPEGDDLPVTRSLAAALAAPAEVVTVPRDWRALLP